MFKEPRKKRCMPRAPTHPPQHACQGSVNVDNPMGWWHVRKGWKGQPRATDDQDRQALDKTVPGTVSRGRTSGRTIAKGDSAHSRPGSVRAMDALIGRMQSVLAELGAGEPHSHLYD